MTKSDVRLKALDAATELFHHRSYGDVGLYDVAEKIGLKQGHIFYHFKTKRELALEVLRRYAEGVQRGLDQLSSRNDPAARLIQFLRLSLSMEKFYMRWGCPIASLTDALLRESKSKAERSEVPLIYKMQIHWFARNFVELGFSKKCARGRAESLICGLQGAIHLGQTLERPALFKKFIKDSVKSVREIS